MGKMSQEEESINKKRLKVTRKGKTIKKSNNRDRRTLGSGGTIISNIQYTITLIDNS